MNLKFIFVFILLSIGLTFAGDWKVPTPMAGVEIGSEYMGLPITLGLSKILNEGLVGSGSYFVGRLDSSKYCELYVNLVGTVWLESRFGGTVGLALFPMKHIYESKRNNIFSGSNFYIAPFFAVNVTNQEDWVPTFGVKLLAINK